MLQQPLNKKAESLIVSYVLLISIGLFIAGLVYTWLRFYANVEDSVKCPDGVSIAVMDPIGYRQNSMDSSKLELNLTIQNRGRFNIEGYLIRVHNRTGASTGIYTIYDGRADASIGRSSTSSTFPLKPGNFSIHQFNSTNLQSSLGKICFVEVQPFIKDEQNQLIACSQVSTRKISCGL